MAELIVRDLEDEIVRRLNARAAARGLSAEAEHREILQSVLRVTLAKSGLRELLLAMPNVGEDADFARIAFAP